VTKHHGLTALAVEAAKRGTTRREISDMRGLYLVVQPAGSKSWAFRYRHGGKPAKLTLGTWPQVSLAAARRLAAEARDKLDQGIDPGAEKRDANAAAAERKGDTVENLVARFIELHAKKHTRSWRPTERTFQAEILPRFGTRTVHDIKRRDVIHMLDAIAADRPIRANRTLAAFRRFCNWLIERDIISASPCAGVRAPAPERARDRVLSDDEIRAYWSAADTTERMTPLLKLLVLTGQRRGEVAGMRWQELDEASRTWTLPAERTKNKRAHVVPLPRQAWEIIEALPRIVGDDHVLAATGDRTGFDRATKRLVTRVQPAQPFVLHDVRRTVATGLQRLGVRLEVTEAVLNHTSGSRAGIVGIYQRHDWAGEKADALQRWGDHVEALVTGKAAAKVVRLHG